MVTPTASAPSHPGDEPSSEENRYISRVSDSPEACLSFDFHKECAAKKGKIDRFLQYFDKNHIQVASDGLCFFRAVLVEKTGEKRFAKSYSAEMIVRQFLISYGEAFDECVDQALSILNDNKFAELDRKHVKDTLYKNLSSIYNSKLLSKCFFGEEYGKYKEDVGLFSDMLIGFLMQRLALKKIKRDGDHYNVQMNQS